MALHSGLLLETGRTLCRISSGRVGCHLIFFVVVVVDVVVAAAVVVVLTPVIL